MRSRAAFLVLLLGFAWGLDGAPMTCYSRVLNLSKNITDTVNTLLKYNKMKSCLNVLPPVYLDVHNSCTTTKLRDMLYILENLPDLNCRQLPRINNLRRKVGNLYNIMSRYCYKDLVYFSNDCQALESGQSMQRPGEDRLELLQER
ncbi:cytokine-like protein 1 [Arapaima gigas]